MEKVTLTQPNIGTSDETAKIRPTYQDKNIALCDDLRDLNRRYDPLLMECYLLLLVKSGRATVSINGKTHEMQRNDLFACTPRNVVDNAMLSTDFDALTFIISPDFTLKVIQQTQINFALPLLETSHDVMHLSEQQSATIVQFYNLLNALYQNPNKTGEYSQRVIDLTLQSLIYTCYDIFQEQSNMVSRPPHTSAENILNDFIVMLRTPGKPILNVAQYADALNITPKYFSSVCKRLTGKTANKIIEEETIKNAKLLLQDNRLSIKQIAMQLGFTNQSHFGSFFRRATGLSPQHYRK